MKLAILLLCHEAPEQLARRLAMAFYRHPAVKVYIHYDARRPAADFERLAQVLPEGLQWQLLRDRVPCRWGEYSLVDATLRLMRRALADTEFGADYLALTSGSCMPIRPFASLQQFLARRQGIDFIQAHDIGRGRWVKDGLEEERYRYYFPLNFLTHRKAFDRLTAWQRRLGVRRAMPADLRVHFGSQWFCLTRETSAGVVEAMRDPALERFFRLSWIPDEFAIQTLVTRVQKSSRISRYNLTYYEFDGEGRPLVLDNGHESHLERQPFFFARKVAPEAEALQQHFDAVTGAVEHDLSYFDRIGVPTIDYQAFLTDVQLNRTSRSYLGTIVDLWRGPMDSSRRRYYVLLGSSRAHLLALTEAANPDGALPIFALPFDRDAALVAPHRERLFGFHRGDTARRDHDPSSYLLQLVHAHPSLPTAFALDAAQPGWVRDFVRWDPNATLVDCDPPRLSADQRAAAALAEVASASDGALLRETLALVLSGKPLPRDLFRQTQAEGSHSCHLLTLADVAPDWGDPTIRAVRAGYAGVDASRHFPAHAMASERIWR